MIRSSNLTVLPHPMAVERLAIVLAAAVGHYWFGIDDEARTNYRVMANQALFLLGAEAHARGLARVKHAIEDMAATMRRAADKMEEAKVDEYTVSRLHVGVTNCDALLMILEALPEEPQSSDDNGQLDEAV